MESATPRSLRADALERLLKERGHTFGPVRVAFGRSGIAIGFPRDPMLHISWWAIAAFVVVAQLLRRR
jgi:hypothetical protein